MANFQIFRFLPFLAKNPLVVKLDRNGCRKKLANILVKGLMANFKIRSSKPKFWLIKLIFGHFWNKKNQKKIFKKFASKYLAMKFVIYMGKIIYGNFQNFALFLQKNQHVVKLARNGQHKKLAYIFLYGLMVNF